MANEFVFTVDAHEVTDALSGIKNGQARAINRAINKTLITARAEAARAVAADTGLRVSVVKDAMKIANSNFSTLTGGVLVTGKRIPLIEFHGTGPEPSRGRGRVTYRMGAGGSTTVKSAFIATMRSGHRGIFKRTAKRRLPITELFGPSLPKVAANAAVVAAVKSVTEDALQKNLDHEVAFLIEQRKGA